MNGRNSMTDAFGSGHGEGLSAAEGFDSGRMTVHAASSRTSAFSMGFSRLMTAGARMARHLAGFVPGLRMKASGNGSGQDVPEDILDAVRHGDLPLRDVPEKWRTPEVCWIAVRKDGMALQHVPGECISEKMCLEAVRNNGAALVAVPAAFRSRSMMAAAVRQYPPAIDLVPERMQEQIRREALRQDERAWKDAVRILETAVRQDQSAWRQRGRSAYGFDWDGSCLAASEPLLPLEERLDAVQQDWHAMLHVREEERTLELCRIAVQQNWYAMRAVPSGVKTPEFCAWAVQQDARALEFVPDEFKTPELCGKAVKQDGAALFSVPDRLKTPEMCLEAVGDDGYALAAVPEKWRTPELCARALWGRIGHSPEGVAKLLASVPERVKEDPVFKAEMARVEAGELDRLGFSRNRTDHASADPACWLQNAAQAKARNVRGARHQTPSAC